MEQELLFTHNNAVVDFVENVSDDIKRIMDPSIEQILANPIIIVEKERLKFLINRDGIDDACLFAHQTMTSYRRYILRSNSNKQSKQPFIDSYRAFKQFIRLYEEHFNVSHT